MKKYAVIVAAGSGKRMGSEIPKQFLELAGKPVLMHSIGQFREYDDKTNIIVVLPQEQIPFWKSLLERYSFRIPHIIVKGGDKRFHSVRNGLEIIDSPGLVAIHDGVRPLVSKETIRRCFEAAGKNGSAIPVISPADSIRMVTGQGSVSVNRLHVKLVQTPQVFDANLIKKAYLQDYSDDFTDDATVLERAGETVFLVAGNPENIKITTPEDLLVAETLYPTTL
ncbi:MAG TPA: 2-C-methyl-D-erythritol 4-phosphate cytidylyltransferase [Bacteroidales bacterium]|nr:2-C-methyl-D-erythritol 4-phosphate cytidylyltransferase [Bacteroidales bacterium]